MFFRDLIGGLKFEIGLQNKREREGERGEDLKENERAMGWRRRGRWVEAKILFDHLDP